MEVKKARYILRDLLQMTLDNMESENFDVKKAAKTLGLSQTGIINYLQLLEDNRLIHLWGISSSNGDYTCKTRMTLDGITNLESCYR